MSRYFILLVIFGVSLKINAQIELEPVVGGDISLIDPVEKTDWELYDSALGQNFLLHNPNQLLPLQGLARLKIVNINIGFENDSAFRQMLSNYADISFVKVKADLSSSDQNEILKRIDPFNFFILGIGEGRITANQRSFIKILLEKRKGVIAGFNYFENLPYIPTEEDEHAWLLSLESEAINMAIVAQSIFGGAVPSARAKKGKIGSNGRLDNGRIDNRSWTTRLGYAPPEVVDLNPQKLHTEIDSIVNDGISNKAFPGAQVLVARKGKIVFQKSYGYHTYEGKRAVQNTDIYDYASVSKVTSALPAIMKLHGEGRFKLDATLGEYFPKFRKSNKAHLDFKNILAHNAQLKPYIVYWASTIKEKGGYKPRTFKTKSNGRYNIRITDDLYLHRKYKKKMYKAIKASALEEKKAYKYSGLSFLLYPEMLSSMTGVDYEAYLQNNFYRPLGATTIGFNPYLRFPLDRIVPTERDTFFRMTQVHGAVHDEAAAMLNGVSANAGLFSNANDLAKLFQMYLNGGTYGGERYIKEETINLFTSCQFCSEGNHRGLGFDRPQIDYDPKEVSISSVSSGFSFGHSGYTGTFVWADPVEDLLFIFFSNRVFPTRDNRKLYSMNIRPQILKVIYDSISQ